MLPFIHARLEARRLTHRLRKSLIRQDDNWGIDADRMGRPILCTGHFRLVIVPRALRLFDAIHVFCDEAEVWLPLLPRLRLRAAVRYHLLRYANRQSLEPCMPAEVRVHVRQEQPL